MCKEEIEICIERERECVRETAWAGPHQTIRGKTFDSTISQKSIFQVDDSSRKGLQWTVLQSMTGIESYTTANDARVGVCVRERERARTLKS